MKFLLLLSLLLSGISTSYAGDSTRNIKSVRTNLPIKIDGNIQEDAWKQASFFNNFSEQKPSFGLKEDEATRTEIWLLYDDNAIYVSGFCHERTKDSISSELGGRDKLGINDFAGIMFDTYLDKINGSGFFVTALGEQADVKYSLGYEDDSWSTVFETATKMNDRGWTFEMRIPYAAIRFSNNDVQNWGVNIIRRRAKAGKQYSWNPIDPVKFGTMNQAGVLTDIKSIKAPIRLSFSPYFSTYVNHVPKSVSGKNITSSVNGGMDVKYGVSKGFTLDMTLIPDFGQVQSDNQVLNLSPFEVRFNENRSFFTEGTELFNKGNFFYSRRIGGRPLNINRPYGEINDSLETIVQNPAETKLVNATKFSGRTARGLGIGIFNAVTKPQSATIRKNDTGEEYQIETNPLTNYNIVVLDQTMKNNSSVTLINTNVLRSGSDYDANVTAGLFDLYDKKVDWNVWGKVANSRLMGLNKDKDLSGVLYEINLGKFRGPFNFEIHHKAADNKFQQNDMGYFTNNNYYDYGFNSWYKFIQPKAFYNNINISAGASYSQLYFPRRFQYLRMYARTRSQLKNLWNVSVDVSSTGEQQDFYEARIPGKMFKRPSSFRSGFGISSNPTKKYAASIDFSHTGSREYNSNNVEIFLNNQYRFNDKLSVSLASFRGISANELGFAYVLNPDNVYFGLRKRTTVENILNVKYNFNIKMGLTLRTRHYWSKVDYKSYFLLQDNGYLQPATSANNAASNVNFFNVDMVYTWQFALGSFLNIGWKDASFLYNQQVKNSYIKNLGNTLNSPQENNFSIKLIYFLDYLTLKKKA